MIAAFALAPVSHRPSVHSHLSVLCGLDPACFIVIFADISKVCARIQHTSLGSRAATRLRDMVDVPS
jgi:hypothetical protein